MTQEQRTFTLESWQWRKYKTRDGRDAKIVYANKNAMCVEINDKLFTSYELDGVVHIGLNNEIIDQLFDVPDQKEPRKVFLVYTNEDDTDIKQFCLSLKEPAIKHKDTHWKNQMKVYIDDGRWDS